VKLNTIMASLALAVALSNSPVNAQQLHTEFIDPSGGFTQVVSVSDHGVKTIYVSGQVGSGDDFAAHVESAFSAVVSRLESAGASAADVVKIRIFVKDFDPAQYGVIRETRLRTFSEDAWPTSTMVGVESLFAAEMRVEIEAVAVIADPEVPGARVTIERIGPSNGFSQSVVVTANGTRTIYVSGHVGQGDSLAEQSASVLATIAERLQAAGASVDDLVKIVTYITDYTREDASIFGTARSQVFGSENLPASTLLGVQSLVSDRFKIEVDAVAVVSASDNVEIDTEFIDPNASYTQAITIQASGAKRIYLAGQVGNPDDDLQTQADQVYANLRRRLETAGASTADLVKLTIYMSNYQPGDASVLATARQNNGFNPDNLPATTLIGVESLYSAAALIEIEGEAVVAGI
jgi:enamine deaminase RidA (YjgF/YER057c/UK114 family)